MANKENVQKWIDALLSNRFKQGSGKLRTESKGIVRHCCLGVACEVAMENGVVLEIGELPEVYMGEDMTYYTFDGQSGFLPGKVQDWLGINAQNPIVGYVSSLSDGCDVAIGASFANDSYNWLFVHIANGLKKIYIEGK